MRIRRILVAALCISSFALSGCGRSMERIVIDTDRARVGASGPAGAVTLGLLKGDATLHEPFELGPVTAKPDFGRGSRPVAAKAADHRSDQLSVLSFNTQHRTNAGQREIVARHLQSDLDETPDFILLQEVRFRGNNKNTAASLAKLLNYHVQATKRTSDGEGVAILSRYPFEYYAERHLKNQTSGFLLGFRRVSVMGEFHVPRIGRVRVVNVHFTNWGFEQHVRIAQLEETLQWVAEREHDQPADITVLGGDFNMLPGSREHALVMNAAVTAPLRFEDYNGEGPTRGAPGRPRHRIDYVFIATPGADLHSLGEQRLFTSGLPTKNGKSRFFPSDHVPVLHEFAIGRRMVTTAER